MSFGESYSGVHDIVQMLSLNSDGTVAQQHPETFDDTGDAALVIRFLQQETAVTGGALTALQEHHAEVLADLQIGRKIEITALRSILGIILAAAIITVHSSSFGRGTFGTDKFGLREVS